MKFINALISIVQQELSNIKNAFGWILTAISFSVQDIQGYLSIGIMLATLTWWIIRIVKQLKTKNDSN